MQIAIISLTHDTTTTEIKLALERSDIQHIDFTYKNDIEKLIDAQAYILVADHPYTIDSQLKTLMELLQSQNNQGKVILGIGYAARLLVKTNFIPGLFMPFGHVHLMSENQLATTTREISIRLSVDYQYNAFTRCLSPQDILQLSLNCHDHFDLPPGLLAEIQTQGLDIFLFCDTHGQANSGSSAIAALTNKAGNVMAMLPHPEASPGGDLIFQSIRQHIASGYVEKVAPLYYWPRK